MTRYIAVLLGPMRTRVRFLQLALLLGTTIMSPICKRRERSKSYRLSLDRVLEEHRNIHGV
jgi:hypothetical protein